MSKFTEEYTDEHNMNLGWEIPAQPYQTYKLMYTEGKGEVVMHNPWVPPFPLDYVFLQQMMIRNNIVSPRTNQKNKKHMHKRGHHFGTILYLKQWIYVTANIHGVKELWSLTNCIKSIPTSLSIEIESIHKFLCYYEMNLKI